MSSPEKNPAAVALGKLAKKKLGAEHYRRIGKIGGTTGGGRPRAYKSCPGQRVHVFSSAGVCWFCGKSRGDLLLKGKRHPKKLSAK